MEKEAEKATPTNLTLVHSSPSYEQTLNEMTKTFSDRKVQGQDLDIYTALKTLDTTKDNSVVRDWLDYNGFMTKARFDKTMSKIDKDAQIQKALGFVPLTCDDFVLQYAAQNSITLDCNEIINRPNQKLKLGGVEHTPEECETLPAAKKLLMVQQAQKDNLEDFRRELRTVSRDNALGYTPDAIMDAVTNWSYAAKLERRLVIFQNIAHEKGKATGPIAQDMWIKMEEAAFDVSETQPGYPIAVIKKFIWQVKRKMLGLPVTHHLMPVIVGVTGDGKSTFVEAMTKPVEESRRNVDFKMITEDKIIDIWSSAVLFLDEMGNAARADAETVKNVITTPVITRRVMKTNGTVQVMQQSTLIGCSNKSLAQLIRDDTGLRRFAELQWKGGSDRAILNSIDWPMLWQSVDEEGDDPSLGVFEVLAKTQESARFQSVVEQWAREDGNLYTKAKTSDELFMSFRTWEDHNNPRFQTAKREFQVQLTSLIQNAKDFPWEKKRSAKGYTFRYTGDDL